MNKSVKCCLVGNSSVGKTCMIASYTANSFPHQYSPTVLDTYNALVNVGNEVITLTLYDTSGKEHQEHAQLRQAIMNTCDVIMVCYSVTSMQSLIDIKTHWYPEIKEYAPTIPLILVGTQSDQLNHHEGKIFVPESKAKQLTSEFGFGKLFMCSALTQEGLKQVFDEAIKTCILRYSQTKKRHKKNCEIM